MNQLTRNKVLITIIAVLLITNLVMLLLFFRMNKSEPQKSPGFTERLKKDVGFTAEQMKVYEPKKDTFWANMRKRFDEIKTTKQAFYKYMYDPSVTDSVLNAEADVIGRQQAELDQFVVKHFKEVRTMCTPEQLPKYDSLLPLIIERMTTRPKRK
jgi:protein CpxP